MKLKTKPHSSYFPEYKRSLIVAQSPMRITLGGGGTDVMWYSKLKGGAWISASIDRYVTAVVSTLEDPNIIKVTDYDIVTINEDFQQIPNPIIRECLDITGIEKGIDITYTSDASSKSGLGGSGAFEISLLHALHAYKNENVSQWQLAEEACDIEINRLKKPVGPQDQYISSLGGIQYFEIDTNGNISAEPLNLSYDAISQLEHNLLYFRTGIQRDASAVLADQKKKMENSKKTNGDKQKLIDSLDQIKSLGQRVKKYLLRGNIDAFGESLHEHWMVKKQLSDSVSNPQIDEWYEEARKAGAIGGKIMGAGGGGWFMFYVNDNQTAFRERMKAIGLEERRVNFDWVGTKLLVNIN